MSYPRTGTTGDGYAWLAALGLPLVEPVPALVPLVSPEPWVRELAGVSLQAVNVELRAPDGELLGQRERPVVFTHKGISGPGAMDLSEPVAREEASAQQAGRAARAHALRLDLAPTLERESLRALLASLAGRPGAPMLALVARDRARAAAPTRGARPRASGVGAGARVNELARAARHSLVESVKGLAIPVAGTLGFDQAEVTAGGLALAAVDAATLRVKGVEGLWVFGEILDLAGPIGGLNFQAAFSTAELAARDVSRA